MTAEEFNKLAEKAIEKCFWRNTEFETPICKGNLAPCRVEFEVAKQYGISHDWIDEYPIP